jgi:3-phenylpropionate/trans-cinnamate dioxygenase ferredoxin reductase subunit
VLGPDVATNIVSLHESYGGVRLAGGEAIRAGMVVDEYPCTADHRVFAAGNVAHAFNPARGHLRVKHGATAKDQGHTAGLNMTGRHQRFENLTLVYSDQYDVGLEYTGYAPPGCYDQVVFRGDVAQREFVAFWPDRVESSPE